MKITVKPFSRGDEAIRLAYGRIVDGAFVPTADVRKAPNFSEFGSRSVDGKFGSPSYTEVYDLALEGKKAVFAVQKWQGLNTNHPEKVWEIIHQ